VKRGLMAAVLSLVLLFPTLSRSQTPSTVPAGTEVLIGAPKSIPPGLVEALKKRMTENPDVAEAYLALIYVKREGEVPRLLLFLRIDNVPDFVKELIRDDLGNASRAFLSQDETIDILTEDSPATTAAVAQVVKPFYVRGK
jgi:type III secretion system (T3SS) SseB-like protein